MTVYFIGAGPGAADLLTLRAQRLLEQAETVLYAGSLVPEEIVETLCPKTAEKISTAAMTLDQILKTMKQAHDKGHKTIARLHSGDPSLYSATAEQMRRLSVLNIPFETVPGVPAYCAAAARLNLEFTVPGLAQTVILTRTATRSSPMPEGEEIETLAQSKATLVIHLSINALAVILRKLAPLYGETCPVIIAFKVGTPDERFIRGTIASIRALVKKSGITRTALILVGPALDAHDFPESRLYNPQHSHLLRKAETEES